MYCTNCGKQISDDAKFCSECGTPVVGAHHVDVDRHYEYNNQYSNYNYQQSNYDYNSYQADGSSFGMAVLGFLFPIIGVIMYFSYSKKGMPLRARSCGLGGLAGFFFNVIIYMML